MKCFSLLALVLFLLVVQPSAAVAQTSWTNDIPLRIQWNNNFGYCGEVSMISAGLYYGQYCSQYDARAIVSGGSQTRSSDQLLVGVNDSKAARAMHLAGVSINNRSSQSFLASVKQHVVAGHPVCIGIYMRGGGDADYDHIVPVFSVAGNSPSGYSASDVLSFNDLGERSPYIFSYSFGSFQLTRSQASARNAPPYSLAKTAGDYGIAITGVSDTDGRTLPVRVDTSVNYEPSIRGNSRPSPIPVTLRVTVSGLSVGSTYNLYRYSSFAAIPDSKFNANANKASGKLVIAALGSTYTTQVQIMSNEVAAFRAVPTNAP